MSVKTRFAACAVLIVVCNAFCAGGVLAGPARNDQIEALLSARSLSDVTKVAETAPDQAQAPVPPKPPPSADPRDGEAQFEQAKALTAAIDQILADAAESRAGAQKLPSEQTFILPPLWRETRESRNDKVRALLDSALGIVTGVPLVDAQKKVESLRRTIRDLDDQNAKLKEKQLNAALDAAQPGFFADTAASIDQAIAQNVKRIEANRNAITAAKADVAAALQKSGVDLQADQIDLLLDSVLSGDLVRLVAVFNAAKLVDGQLARLIGATGENVNSARKYFAMHATLFALLVHAQDSALGKIDTQYLPKLDAIIGDIKSAGGKTAELLRAENRPDQKRALDANTESQKLAGEAAKAYRRYLTQQRNQIAEARRKAAHDLKIADNTYATVEASVQLRKLMKESSASFEAVQHLEAPSLEPIFKNEELRREFENLTRKLDTPST